MAIYPGAKKRLIAKWNKVAMTRYRRMNLHVAVMNGDSAYDWFAGTDSACAHFYVAKDGSVEQYIDTKYRSASDLHGNDSTISVETAGGVTKPNEEEWTAAQVLALAKLWAWARDEHGITDKLATNTQTNENSAGLSWHRLGVQGNFAGRPGVLSVSYKPGGILYSKAAGKECPGDAKILQIPGIWKTAHGKTYKEIGGTTAPAKTVSASKPTTTATAKKTTTATAKQPTNYAKLAVDGKFGAATVKAVQIVMRAIKTYTRAVDGQWGTYTIRGVQAWLRKLGYYPASKYVIDGKWGKYSVLALQKFLRKKGLYTSAYLLDGSFGPATVKAFQKYLNQQRG